MLSYVHDLARCILLLSAMGALLCFCSCFCWPLPAQHARIAAALPMSWYCAAPETTCFPLSHPFSASNSIDCIALCGPVGSPGRQRRSAVHVLHHCSDQRSPGAGSAPGRRRRGGLCRQGCSQGQGSRQWPLQRPGRALSLHASTACASQRHAASRRRLLRRAGRQHRQPCRRFIRRWKTGSKQSRPRGAASCMADSSAELCY